MDTEARALELFERFARLIQFQVEIDGATRVWFATGIMDVISPSDDDFRLMDPSVLYTDAVELDDLDDRELRDALAEFRDDVLVARLLALLPHVWHRPGTETEVTRIDT